MPRRNLAIVWSLRCIAAGVASVWTTSAGAAEGAHGDYTFFGDLAFWYLPAFLLFVWVIYKLLWGVLTRGMSDREAEEKRLIAQAEQARREAEELLRDHRGRLEAVDEEVRELIDEAHRDAEHTRQDIVATAHHEAETLRRRARREIQRARDQSLDEIFQAVNERVITATEQRLAGRLTLRDHQQLIEHSLRQFESRN